MATERVVAADTRDSLFVRLAALALLCAVVAWASSRLGFVDPDLWHELALAREIVRDGAVPVVDRFAYTPTVTSVVHHEWGAGLLLYAVVSLFGGDALAVLRSVLAALVVALAALCARRRGARLVTIALLAPAALTPAAAGFTTIRAQVLTLVFVALLLRLLEEDRRGRRWWIALWLPLHVVWLNLHGGFVVGGVLLALHAAEEAIRRRPVGHLIATGGAMAASVVVHPFGLAYPLYLARALTLDRSSIGEWGPLWRQGGELLLPLFGLTAALALYAVYRLGFRATPGLAILGATAVAGLLHARHFSIYAVAWLALVPSWVEATPAGAAIRRVTESRRRVAAALLLAGAVAFAVPVSLADLTRARVPRGPRIPGRVGLVYPTGAVKYLAERRFSGNLQVPFVAGGYVAWRLHPDVRISLDGRYEVAYPTSLLQEHIEFYAARGRWWEMLDRYPTDAVLVPTDAPVAKRFGSLSGWRRAYRDDSFEVWVREGVELEAADRRGQVAADSLP